MGPERPPLADGCAAAERPRRLSLIPALRPAAGDSLHKRGYREGIPIHRGGLNEAAAAGILALAARRAPPTPSLPPCTSARAADAHRSTRRHAFHPPLSSPQGWVGAPAGLETLAPAASAGGGGSADPVLADPMCGSGTFLIEGCAAHPPGSPPSRAP